MKPFSPVAAFLAMVATVGCRSGSAPAQATHDAPAPTVELGDTPSSATAIPSASALAAAPMPSAPKGDVLVGKVTTTKGATPVVAGRLLSAEAFRERFGADWRDKVMGERVRLVGRLHVHVCRAEEQCLTTGEIHSLQDISAIELCAGSKSTADVEPVDCPNEDTAGPSATRVAPPGLVVP